MTARLDTAPFATDDPFVLPTRRTPGRPFDPPAELDGPRSQGPLTRLALHGGQVGWLVTGYEAARSILGDPRFSTRHDRKGGVVPGVRPEGEGGAPPPGFFGGMDAPEHTRYRRLLTGRFTVHRMKRLEPRIAEIAAGLLDAMERAGTSADLVGSYALPIPSLVICELLGIPYDDHELFQRLTTTMIDLEGAHDESEAAQAALTAYLRDQVERKHAERGEGLLGDLVAGGELTDEEVTNIALLLLVAGHETTTHMIALSTFALLEHPDRLAALRATPALIDTAVEELLRYLSVLHYGGPRRGALDDVEVDGTLIRAGETVVFSLPAINRDPAVFPDPDTLRFDRPNARRHLALGHGIHQCLGQQLARIEMRIALPALLDRFPDLRLAVPAAEIPFRESFPVYGLWRLPVAWGAGE